MSYLAHVGEEGSMVAGVQTREWRWRHSLWILATLTLGVFNWAAFLYIGLRARQIKWLIWAAVYSIPLFIMFIAQGRTQGWLLDLSIISYIALAFGSMVHALVARSEYLSHIAILEGTKATITQKGNVWEIRHSLWLIFVFTLGILNWVAFLYIGLSASNRKWILWSLLYFCNLVIFGLQSTLQGLANSVALVLFLALASGSVAHAFATRREYLLTLEAKERGEASAESADQHRTPTNTESSSHHVGALHPAGTRQSGPLDDAHPVSVPLSQAASSTPALLPIPPILPTSSAAVKFVPPPPAITTLDITPLPQGQARPQIESASKESNRTNDVEPSKPNTNFELDVSKAYPFPIAYGYRLLDSLGSPLELYREQLRVAENLLAFLASVSLCLIAEKDRPESGIDLAGYWGAGASPGDWRDMVARTSSKVFGKYREHVLAKAIQRLNIGANNRGFGADVDRLIKAKNDFKHDRGPFTEEDIILASKEIQAALNRCMESLRFFTQFPLRQVFEINVDRRGRNFQVRCLRLTGDHPGLPQEQLTLPSAVHKGDVYIDIDGHWVSLYPFLTVRNCPRCKVRETFFIDKWDLKRKVAYVKSFERGHTEEVADISEALFEWVGHTQSTSSA